MSSSPPNEARPSRRDQRIDFIRGLALMVIFVNHIPENEGRYFTPSRYGFSDSAEVFLFLSGMVTAWVLRRNIERSGLLFAIARLSRRVMQIYGAHLALFGCLALIALLGEQIFPRGHYVEDLDIGYFFDATREALPALLTLRYLPAFVDVLPVYLILLVWTPAVWFMGGLHRWLPMILSVALYAATRFFDLGLSAKPGSDIAWYFNPFAWQMVFFCGFSMGAGWLAAPLRQTGPVLLSSLIVAVSVPIAHLPTLIPMEAVAPYQETLDQWADKQDLGFLRVLHFAALAYLVGSWLQTKPAWINGRYAAIVSTLGRHSLTMFCLGVALSEAAGIILDQFGHANDIVLAVNLAGIGVLIVVAQVLDRFAAGPAQPIPVGGRLVDSLAATNGHAHRSAMTVIAIVGRHAAAAILLVVVTIAPFLLPRTQEVIVASAPAVDPSQAPSSSEPTDATDAPL